jgi:hypothetical protein
MRASRGSEISTRPSLSSRTDVIAVNSSSRIAVAGRIAIGRTRALCVNAAGGARSSETTASA